MTDPTNPIDDKDPSRFGGNIRIEPNEPTEAAPGASRADQIKTLALTEFREAKTALDGAISEKHLATDRLATARARFTEAERTARRVGAIPKVGRKPKTEASK
jgi:hypothetical protein